MQKLMLTAIAALALICVGCPKAPEKTDADASAKKECCGTCKGEKKCKEGCTTKDCKGCAEKKECCGTCKGDKKKCKEGCTKEDCKGCVEDKPVKKGGCCGTCGGGKKEEAPKTE